VSHRIVNCRTYMRRSYYVDQGFSLLELLVVVAITAILAALLLPALSRAKAQAHSTTCKNLLRQIGTALQMYVDEHQGKFPHYRGLPDLALSNSAGANNSPFWSAKLLPYYPVKWTDPAYHCPGYNGSITWSTTHGGPFGSFAYNSSGVSRKGRPSDQQELGLGGWVSLPRRHGLSSEIQVRAPSEMFAIGESRWKADRWAEEGGHDHMLCGHLAVNRGPCAFDPARHGKNYNQLFCDGHVSAMSPWVLFNPTNTAVMWNYDHLPHPESWPRD
jgi:prepilin-type N-terminal cleavage/methylation domain-containing protein/prepilin-type processing-associated H-X9-DG protein